MHLLLFIDNTLISSAPVNPHKLNSPGYLTSLKEELLELNNEIVETSEGELQFYLDGIPSSMNAFASFDVDAFLNKTLFPDNKKNQE